MRAPDTASYMSIRSSRSRNAYRKTAIAPTSSPWAPIHSRWFIKRVSSSNITRMYCARIGTSTPISFSIAITYACSLHIIDT